MESQGIFQWKRTHSGGDLASCRVWAASPSKPIASRGTYGAERGRYMFRENLLWMWLWESCVDGWWWPTAEPSSRDEAKTNVWHLDLQMEEKDEKLDQVHSEVWVLALWKMSRCSGSPQVIKLRLSTDFVTSFPHLIRERTLKINTYF